MQGRLEGATFACNKGRGIADKDSEKAHGLGYEEHVIVGAELAKVGNTAEIMGLQIWRKELRDVVEDGFGCLRHGFWETGDGTRRASARSRWAAKRCV